MNTIKIATLNVNGISRHKKRTRIFNYLRSLKADIFCLQETHGNNKNITDRSTEEWGGQVFGAMALTKAEGQAFYLEQIWTLKSYQTLRTATDVLCQ